MIEVQAQDHDNQLLPKFEGIALEEHIHHLEIFEEMCITLKASDIGEEQIKMRVFFFSLKDGAKDWYYTLLTFSIST